MPLRVAAVCGLCAPLTWALGIVLGALAQPDAYSSADDDISDLGALTASHAWLYNQIAANLTGILIVVFALGLWSALSTTKLGQGGAALLAVMGAGQFLDGIFRLDCRGIDAACVNESWHAEAHRIESGFTSTALLLAPLVLAFAFRQRREWHALWIPTIAVVPAVILVSGFAVSSGNGAASRAGAIVWFIWLALAAAWLLRLPHNPEEPTRAPS